MFFVNLVTLARFLLWYVHNIANFKVSGDIQTGGVSQIVEENPSYENLIPKGFDMDGDDLLDEVDYEASPNKTWCNRSFNKRLLEDFF